MHDTAYTSLADLHFTTLIRDTLWDYLKVFRPIRKVAKKIIPKEIRPALPYITSASLWSSRD